MAPLDAVDGVGQDGRVPVRERDDRPLREGTKVSERSGAPADDPFGGRHPTSHERLTGLPWDASYHDGPAPWDLGHPQPAIVRLASEGGFAGAVLDAPNTIAVTFEVFSGDLPVDEAVRSL